MATGHAMLGLSLGAGTGKLVSEILNEEKLSMDITPFDSFRSKPHPSAVTGFIFGLKTGMFC
jgi:glycine/D-amino acid oxidase-like deaminating enzyme